MSLTLWKYVKFAYISTIQYGILNITVPMNARLHHLVMNGFNFIHAMTLCSTQEALSGMAATDSHHPYIGWLKRIKKPWSCQHSSLSATSHSSPANSP